MNLDIPDLKCCISIENFALNGSIARKHMLKNALLKLCRSSAGECVLSIVDKNGKEAKRFVISNNHENYRLNTKFAREGKSSITLPEFNVRLFLSNCPTDDLAKFLRGFSLKCNYYSKKNPDLNENSFGLMTRQVSNIKKSQQETIEKISPLTSKDIIRNLALRDQSNINKNGACNAKFNQSSPIASSKRANFQKRKLENVLEVISDSSPNTKKKLVKSIIPSPVRSLCVLNSSNLTNEQYNVLSAVMHSQNVFFTGNAGTGKSYLLKHIISRLPPETTFVTASTGISASHIGGITLHMFAGIPSNWMEQKTQQGRKLTANEIASRLLKYEAKVQRWRQCKCLIVDEISMVPGDYFKLLDQVARIIRKMPDKPFGGIQIVLCGDFLQLPPIIKKQEINSIKHKYAFQTDSWKNAVNQCFELRIIKRQTDEKMIKVLQYLRIGKITDSVKSVLIDTSKNNLRKGNLIPTQLYTHRRDVDLVNTRELQKLTTPPLIFAAQDSDATHSAILDTLCPTPRKIELKVGAQVMLNRNVDVNKGLVNGLVGTITKFVCENEHSASNRHLPYIRFVNGLEATIRFEKWVVNSAEGKPIIRRHLPIQPAYALSIHKSQGMTISNGLEISLAKVFETGQAYVALSRATSLENVKILDFNPRNIIVDSDALAFYKELKYI